MTRIALIVAALLLPVQLVCSQTANATRDELTQIHSKLKDATKNIEQLRSEREKLLLQLESIELQYGAAAGSLRDLGVQIGGKRQRLKHLNTQLHKLQTDLEVQKEELAKQIKASFVMGKKEPLRLLLNQQDPGLASRMLVYYDYLNKSRLKKLTALQENIAILEKLEQEKQRETGELAQAVESQKNIQIGLDYTKKQRDALLLKLQQEFEEKRQQLDQLDNSVSASQAVITKLEQEAEQYAMQYPVDPKGQPAGTEADSRSTESEALSDVAKKAFAMAENKPFAEMKGHLPWPVHGGSIKKLAGTGGESRSDDVLILAKEGSGVRAIANGRVVFSKWMRGYGLLIIISHGHGYMSLYGFNQSLYKKAGDYVKAGSLIASVGSSGGRKEVGLYFAIRNKRQTINPSVWCTKA